MSVAAESEITISDYLQQIQIREHYSLYSSEKICQLVLVLVLVTLIRNLLDLDAFFPEIFRWNAVAFGFVT